MRDYQLISPSLEGILSHQSVVYEGVKRPVEILRALDGPAKHLTYTENEQAILKDYFHDIHEIFLKKFSSYILDACPTPDETLKLQAMLQEIIKVKTLISRSHVIE